MDIKEEHPDEKTLREYHERSGLPLRRFFNTSGQLYREMGLSKKLPDMDEALKDADVMDHCLKDTSKEVKEKERARFDRLCAEFGM